MGRLLLVRHGQASAGSADYDRLSELGWRQAAELGKYWARLGIVPDRVFVGPCRRQRETAEAVAGMFTSGPQNWPDIEPLAELDEHDGYLVFTRSLPALAESDTEAQTALDLVDQPADSDIGLYYRVYRRVTRRWARGELDLPAGEPVLEDWPAFRRRAESAVAKLINGAESGRTVVAFTSSGPVAVAVGRALGLDDEEIVSLSWTVRNGAVSEFLFSGDRFSLHSFNSQLHLVEPGLESWV
jgi:broad specificity phosphatase PhoE